MSLVGNLPYDLVGLDGREPSSEFSASSEREERVNRIDIEGYVEFFIAHWVKICNRFLEDFSDTELGHMVHGKGLYLQLFDVDPLIRVNIPYRDVHNILKGDLVDQPIKSWYLCKACGMSNWKTMVILVVAFAWIAQIGMCIDPDDFKVLVVRVKSVECGRSNSVISSYSQHDAVWMFFESCQDAIVDLSQQIIEQLQVSHVVVGLHFVGLGWLVVYRADIAQIDCFNLVLLLQRLKEVGLSEEIGSCLNALNVLALPNCSTEVEQPFGRGYFYLFSRNHRITAAN